MKDELIIVFVAFFVIVLLVLLCRAMVGRPHDDKSSYYQSSSQQVSNQQGHSNATYGKPTRGESQKEHATNQWRAADDLSGPLSEQVTQRQYKMFLDSMDDLQDGEESIPDTLPSYCHDEDGYWPLHDTERDGGCGELMFDPEENPDKPVSCVSWCAAAAYCAWEGKKLCPSKHEPPTLRTGWGNLLMERDVVESKPRMGWVDDCVILGGDEWDVLCSAQRYQNDISGDLGIGQSAVVITQGQGQQNIGFECCEQW